MKKVSKKFKRNIGLISLEQQEKLKQSKVLICGLGGMGGICAEALVRMGIENIVLVDKDKFEETNFNRQIHSNDNSKGFFKVKVLENEFLKINPNLNILAIAERVSTRNVNKILEGVDIVVNAMDDMKSSLILERTSRKMGKTIVDAWITPFASVFVLDKDSPHWEDFLDLPTKGKLLKDITKKDLVDNLAKEVQYTLSHFNPYDYVDKEIVKKVVNNQMKRPSFVLVTWFSGLLMANEVFKIIAGYEPEDYKGIFFNQYTHTIIKGNL